MEVTYQKCVELSKMVGLPIPTEEQFEHGQFMLRKFNEYKAHFGDLFDIEEYIMTDDEIVRGIDRCIKYNRKWEGFIVPEIDYEDNDI